MNLHVVLFEPEIPANTGNIARTCLATDTTLHLIHPLGFSTDDRMLKRAGLDYWKFVDVKEYESIDHLFHQYKEGNFYFIEDFGEKYYTDCNFAKIEGDLFLIFGKETAGIPKKLIRGLENQCLRIPMNNDRVRSLNLSNTVAIVLYEVLRQCQFKALK